MHTGPRTERQCSADAGAQRATLNIHFLRTYRARCACREYYRCCCESSILYLFHRAFSVNEIRLVEETLRFERRVQMHEQRGNHTAVLIREVELRATGIFCG
jgi:hypothetical protein